MNIDERRDLIETLVHDYEHELDTNLMESERYAKIKAYRQKLYGFGAIDLLEHYEAWQNETH